MHSPLMSTSERLIEATREPLWERGYVGTSPKAVQRAACAGQGSMYHHFAGKPDLTLPAPPRPRATVSRLRLRTLVACRVVDDAVHFLARVLDGNLRTRLPLPESEKDELIACGLAVTAWAQELPCRLPAGDRTDR
ncbi:hypothetical protein GCM10018791_23330 [Streptomyces zaomyceticus]|nr:hypothetical protein GCM10018791_23330 [Streptomyces zaomyceticus]